jgi:DNA-directed RNA polymerase specialized sigma24 family protein
VDQHPTKWRRVSSRRPDMGDQALVAALRCEDEGALREFFLRFRPALLLAARGLGVDAGERAALVDDCLADVAVHLITSGAPAPRSLPAYLARSLRNRVLNAARGRARAERRELEDALWAEPTIVPNESDAPPLAPALRRLAAALEGMLNEEERLLAVWMSHCVPQPEIARWLGIGSKAAAKRIERLRQRLQRAALGYIETVAGDERRELLTFLGRASLAPGPAARLAATRAAVEEPIP